MKQRGTVSLEPNGIPPILLQHLSKQTPRARGLTAERTCTPRPSHNTVRVFSMSSCRLHDAPACLLCNSLFPSRLRSRILATPGVDPSQGGHLSHTFGPGPKYCRWSDVAARDANCTETLLPCALPHTPIPIKKAVEV